MQAPAPRKPTLVQLYREDPVAIRAELLAGLSAQQAHTSPKYLYDALGSRLFEAITALPEYYPTRIEAEIFTAFATDIAKELPRDAALVDLGAGNCAKAASLFESFQPSRYVAVDISVDFLTNALECLQRQFPAMDMVGVGMDFSSSLVLPEVVGTGPRTLFYPGSSIGNFTPAEALGFLRQARTACNGGALVIGVDLVKDKATLDLAYDDPLQVTAAFNRNLLRHFNAIAQTDFALADWAHRAFFDERLSRIEMHLVAQREVTVSWPGGSRRFNAGETIHTEISCKWRVPDFTQLLSDAGFRATRHWTDPRGWFAVFEAQA